MRRRTLALLSLLASVALGAHWQPSATVASTYNDNLSNAGRAADRVRALLLSAEGAIEKRASLAPNLVLAAATRASAEVVPRYEALTTLTAGAGLQLEKKLGLGAFAPRFSAGIFVAGVAARDRDRDGTATRLDAAWRQRLDEATEASLSVAWTRREARAAVYSGAGTTITAGLRRAVGEHFELSGAVFLRRGDVVSYATPPRPDLVALARERRAVTTFGRPMIAYAIDAETLGGSLALARRIGDATSVQLAGEYRDTQRAPLRYVNPLVTLTLLHHW